MTEPGRPVPWLKARSWLISFELNRSLQKSALLCSWTVVPAKNTYVYNQNIHFNNNFSWLEICCNAICVHNEFISSFMPNLNDVFNKTVKKSRVVRNNEGCFSPFIFGNLMRWGCSVKCYFSMHTTISNTTSKTLFDAIIIYVMTMRRIVFLA